MAQASSFEAAVDAIVRGDAAQLRELLRAEPDLVRQRSEREHHSTLLHYVSANGVEDSRQNTPANVVEIAALLLDAGADVNAESDAYGERSTALGLTATSCHPYRAGVQRPLMQLLIDRGARIDGPDAGSGVNGCLHNGRGEAAVFLAEYGATLDLEGACGVGRLDVVQELFATATEQQKIDGFAWACQFGRTEVAEFLLEYGVTIDAKLRHHGQTGLHWAAWGGHPATVRLLLQRGADTSVKDPTFGGTALDWARHASANGEAERGASPDEVIEILSARS